MILIFVYGAPAAGKYTVSKLLADEIKCPLFHNHLIVDAVASVFPFGSPTFVRLREAFWLEMFRAACDENRSMIFTFQPETTVSSDFAENVADLVRQRSGRTLFVRLKLSRSEQETRIANADRRKFGKLRDPVLLNSLHDEFEACEAAMPEPDLVIDTGKMSAIEAADRIREFMLKF